MTENNIILTLSVVVIALVVFTIYLGRRVSSLEKGVFGADFAKHKENILRTPLLMNYLRSGFAIELLVLLESGDHFLAAKVANKISRDSREYQLKIRCLSEYHNINREVTNNIESKLGPLIKQPRHLYFNNLDEYNRFIARLVNGVIYSPRNRVIVIQILKQIKDDLIGEDAHEIELFESEIKQYNEFIGNKAA